MPKVSVIVPIYKVEKYLARCMDSLQKQTLYDIEIILIDDESPDNCPILCDAYAKEDSRIIVIHKKNEGLGFARNSGLEIAKGEFVAFVDSDDYVNLNMFEELYNMASKNNLDAVYCNFNRVFPNGNAMKITEIKKDSIFTSNYEINNLLFGMIGAPPSYPSDRIKSVSVCFGLYSKKLIENYKISFSSEKEFISEDLIFNINLLLKAKRIGLNHTHHYYYCENENSLTKTYRKDRFEFFLIQYKEINRILTINFPKKNWQDRADRYLIGETRRYILKEINKVFSKIEARSKMKYIRNNPYFQKAILRYPYKKLPYKHAIFIWLYKNKFYNIIRFLQM